MVMTYCTASPAIAGVKDGRNPALCVIQFFLSKENLILTRHI